MGEFDLWNLLGCIFIHSDAVPTCARKWRLQYIPRVNALLQLMFGKHRFVTHPCIPLPLPILTHTHHTPKSILGQNNNYSGKHVHVPHATIGAGQRSRKCQPIHTWLEEQVCCNFPLMSWRLWITSWYVNTSLCFCQIRKFWAFMD